jgi:hypothetical protein
LETKSVILFDNASYPNVQINRRQTSNARKGEMMFWMDTHDIWYSSGMTKLDLYDLTKMHKSQYETSAIDCLLADHRHTVTKLPSYHPDLNSIGNI